MRAGGEPARPENLTVRVYYQGRLVRADVAMSSASDDYAGAPRESEGEDGVSAPVASAGELRALAVFVPLPSGARWHFVDVSKLDPAARAIRIDLALPQAASTSPLHISMTLREDGSLVETRGAGRCVTRKSNVRICAPRPAPARICSCPLNPRQLGVKPVSSLSCRYNGPA